MEPLTRLSGKYTRFEWSEEQQEAFEKAKKALINACYLKMPDWSKPFVMFTDASEVAVASVLTQTDDSEKGLCFIAFGSKKLTETQRNWSPTERELYAIVWGCEHFENIVKGSKLLIYSDHQSLEYLTSLNSPKIRRWAIRLSEYNPSVKHIAGVENNIADWLSRAVPDDESGLPEYVYVPEVYHLLHEPTDLYTLPPSSEMAEQAKLDEGSLPKGTLDWYEGAAYGRKGQKLYIPRMFRERLLLWFHASRFGGHQGVVRSVNRMRKFVWWPNWHKDVEEFIKACPVCNATKCLRTSHGTSGALDSSYLFRMVSLDHVGPRTFKGQKYYILVIVDHYSRYMVPIVCNDATAASTTSCFRDHWVAKFGAPATVLTDRGTAFTSVLFQQYVERNLQAKISYASVQYPQGNGINESAHRILETAMKTRSAGEGTSIEDIVADAVLLYNVTPNRSIGDTPASLVFGIDLPIPGLQEFEPAMNERARLTQLRNYRFGQLLIDQLKEIQVRSEPARPEDSSNEFRSGDIVTYTLSTSERKRVRHYSEEPKFSALRSFPHRVTRVTDNNLIMSPLWTKGPSRTAPKVQCRKITSFIPEQMREEVQRLYPKVSWKKPDEEKSGGAVVEDPATGSREITVNRPDEDASNLTAREQRSKKRQRVEDKELP